jgi:hypothetical protein
VLNIAVYDSIQKQSGFALFWLDTVLRHGATQIGLLCNYPLKGISNARSHQTVTKTRSRGLQIGTGVDAMITRFGNFCHFSAKKLAFFSTTNVMIIFSKIGFVLSQKRQLFC